MRIEQQHRVRANALRVVAGRGQDGGDVRARDGLAQDGDGAVTVQFGGWDGKITNCLPIMAGWNYTVRLYRPRAEILNGTWKFPTARAVLAFLGIVIVGTVGFVGRLAADVGPGAQHRFASVLGWAIGVPFAAGLFIIIAVLVVYALHPKNTAGPRVASVAVVEEAT